MTQRRLVGLVTDKAGHQSLARNLFVEVLDGSAIAGWPSGITQWIRPMALSKGTVFYASPVGSDTNPGTFAQPWRSLTRANTLSPGQTLVLLPGEYGAIGQSFTWTAMGTETDPVTISGAEGMAFPVIRGKITMRGPWQRWAASEFDGPTGNVGGPGPLGESNFLNLDGSHLEVFRCVVHGCQWHAGISPSNASDYRILDCYVHDNGGLNGDYRTTDSQWNTSHGCYISPSSFGLLANCIIEHNDAKGIMGRHDSNHIIIANCTIVANGRHGSEAYEQSHDWIWANNIVLNNGNVKGGTGISMGGSGGVTYLNRRNVFWNNGTSGASHWSGTGNVSEPRIADPRCVRPAVYTDHQDLAPNWDHRLLSGSPAIGYADPLYALPFDIEGRARGTSPDCGAYQHA